ncbi:hypothetical protein BAUCODRAFT_118479 [Baudoinia panamericana UAMH 10762]|uniref:Uncharacterized protein n=1 Tax=Baudoinia panamericana (strain UAMH 10762) TaxID=717646 RepID=M2NMI8_BAUPA|nr:uncharacterized protein BAUCODRAFT_118479 [Baudoinia panamericana UAMH 10762]EMD00740.1 hypothetical protein BAUCODRAFT_118479 [Baudoinia panamericana UAMH 10762]
MAVKTAGLETAASNQQPVDSSLQPFLQRDFDPADYLNSSLSSLATAPASAQIGASNGQPVPLQELSSQLQNLLTQLNAQATRLSTNLTQLTDEIIRSGSRLAYEVEVLRGDANSLTHSIDSGLRQDIELFTPAPSSAAATDASNEGDGVPPPVGQVGGEPEYLDRLRTLTNVRSRLDAVIKVFGEAMAWPLAPSELATTSLVAVSAPASDADLQASERKGKGYMEQLRDELNDLIGSGDDPAGLDAAAARVAKLRSLAEVWRGTVEEKARMRLVDSLQTPIEEKQRALEEAGRSTKTTTTPARGVDHRYGDLAATRTASEGGYGFLQNLRNLKNEVYLE